MIEINQIADVLNYIEGLKAVVFDLDDTLYGEKEYIRSGYSAVAKVIPQVRDVWWHIVYMSRIFICMMGSWKY